MGTNQCKVNERPKKIICAPKEKSTQKIGASKNLFPQFFVLIVTSLTLLSFLDACEVVLKVDSGNISLLCTDGNCEAKSSAFKVRRGDRICIVYDNYKSLTMTVTDICRWRTYVPLDPTSRRVKVKFLVCERCNQTGDEKCNATLKGPCYERAFKLINSVKMEGSSNLAIGTCSEDMGSICYTYTTSIRQGDLYGILGVTGGFHYTRITLKVKHLDQEIIADENVDLSSKKLQLPYGPEMLISVINSPLDEVATDTMIQYDGQYFFVNRSELAGLEDSFFGDMEVFLPREDSNAPKVSHTVLRSFFSRDGFKRPRDVEVWRRRPLLAKTCETTGGDEAYIQLGTKVADFESEFGKCKITYSGSFGCSSGNASAAFVFDVTDIDKPGMIPIRSDCSFLVNSIPCNPGQFVLLLKKDAQECTIRMPTLSKQERYPVSKEDKLVC